MNRCASTWPVVFLALLTSLTSCDERPNPGPQGDSHTNWLRTCEADRDCAGLQCLCGVCTAPCSTDDACAEGWEGVIVPGVLRSGAGRRIGPPPRRPPQRRGGGAGRQADYGTARPEAAATMC